MSEGKGPDGTTREYIMRDTNVHITLRQEKTAGKVSRVFFDADIDAGDPQRVHDYAQFFADNVQGEVQAISWVDGDYWVRINVPF